MRPDLSPTKASQSQKDKQSHQEADREKKNQKESKDLNWWDKLSNIFKNKFPAATNDISRKKDKPNELSSQLTRQQNGGGLPNIGNSCYVNSVIQFLYAAEEYRKYLILLRKTHRTQGAARCLGQLFFMMENNKSNEYKSQSIQQLLHKIQLNTLKQDDAFKTINTMLNKIDSSLRYQQPLSNMFKAQYTQSCNCFSEGYQFQTMFLTVRPEVCGRCNVQIKKYFRKKPEYLILAEYCIPTPDDVVYLYEKRGNKPVAQPYHLIAEMIYVGNGFQGHYICVRSKGMHKTLYNDSQALSLETKDGKEAIAYFRRYGRSLILLYQCQRSPYNQYNSSQSEQFQKEEKYEYFQR